MGLISKVIPLKLLLGMVPSPSAETNPVWNRVELISLLCFPTFLRSVWTTNYLPLKTFELVTKLYSFCLLLRSHQALQQTNFGRVPCSLSQVRLKNFGCISPHLPRFQVIENEALSIQKKISTIKVVSMSKRKSCFV